MDKMQEISFNEYQRAALSTAVYPDLGKAVYPTLGLAGEAGEVAEKIKKYHRDGVSSFEAFQATMRKELGDVLWYVAVIADELGMDLIDIAEANIAKLAARKTAGTLQGSGDDR